MAKLKERAEKGAHITARSQGVSLASTNRKPVLTQCYRDRARRVQMWDSRNYHISTTLPPTLLQPRISCSATLCVTYMSLGSRVVSRLPAGVRDWRWGATAHIGETPPRSTGSCPPRPPLRRCRGLRVWRGHGDSVSMTTVATFFVVDVMGCGCSDSAIVVFNL